MKRYRRLTLAAGAVALGSFACGEGSTPVVGTDGAGITIAVAPLDGSGIGVACFDLQVTTELGTLWEKGDPAINYLDSDDDTICSDDHGNAGGGSIRWVGSCDAQDAADTDPNGRAGVQNSVTLWFDGIYNEAKTAETAGVYDPCGTAGCTLEFDCIANTDTLAEFNFTVIRDAENGFFDIAVRFDNIYCASKYDDCYSNNQDITLFSDDDGDHKTGVYALACTAPFGKEVDLHYGNLAVVCSGVTFPIDPTVSARTEAASVPAGHLLTYDVYRDQTTVNCDDDTVDPPVTGNCNGLFWNISFDLTDLEALGGCTLAFSATATNGTGSFVSGLPTNPGATYPYIDVDATITGGDACQQNPLNGDGSAVVTNYHGDFGLAAVAMCFTYDGSAVSGTGNAACNFVPPPAPAGNYLAAYTGSCNPPDDQIYPNLERAQNPIECAANEICVPGGPYRHGQCVPNTTRLCSDMIGDDCSQSTVQLTFTRPLAVDGGTIYAGTFISTATDPDNDPETGWQYNYMLTEDVEFLDSTVSVVGTAVLFTDDLASDDRPNIGANTLTVIGMHGVATPPFDDTITVNNVAAAIGGNTDLFCLKGESDDVGICIEKGQPQACDPFNMAPQCPTGSICEYDMSNNGRGRCRLPAGVGVRCSGSLQQMGFAQCQPGLNCMTDPTLPENDPARWEAHCMVPGVEGDPCSIEMQEMGSQCGTGFYCRPESEDYATCAPRKAVGDICAPDESVMGSGAWVGNCLPGLICEQTYANQDNPMERKCAVNAPLDDGAPCWVEGEEQSLRKCKGHCDIDVNNPFMLGNDGVCRPDLGEGEFCHVDDLGDEDFGGYCRRGLYCNEEGAGRDMSGGGTCRPIGEIGSVCDLQSMQPDNMCGGDQICGGANLPLMNGEQGYCVDRGCGNRVTEQTGFSGEGEIGLMVVWAGQCSDDQVGCNSDVDCTDPATCSLSPFTEFTETPGLIGMNAPHGFVVGDSVKVLFDTDTERPWEVRTVATVVNAWTFTLSGSVPAGTEEAEIATMDYEMCDDGQFNCDTVVNGEYVCQCGTLCMMQQ